MKLRLIPLALTGALTLVACGGSDGDPDANIDSKAAAQLAANDFIRLINVNPIAAATVNSRRTGECEVSGSVSFDSDEDYNDAFDYSSYREVSFNDCKENLGEGETALITGFAEAEYLGNDTDTGEEGSYDYERQLSVEFEDEGGSDTAFDNQSSTEDFTYVDDGEGTETETGSGNVNGRIGIADNAEGGGASLAYNLDFNFTETETAGSPSPMTKEDSGSYEYSIAYNGSYTIALQEVGEEDSNCVPGKVNITTIEPYTVGSDAETSGVFELSSGGNSVTVTFSDEGISVAYNDEEAEALSLPDSDCPIQQVVEKAIGGVETTDAAYFDDDDDE
jgi:hypothetical protein